MTNMAFFYKKPEGLDCETSNFSWRHKRPVVKKHLKIIFFTVQPFIVKMQFEICKYFPLFFLPLTYLMCCFEASVQLVPKFYSHPSCSLFELKLGLLSILILHKTVFNSYPNIIQKWNCTAGNLQIFLSEIIRQQENGGGGGNLTQILYFPFYMGIAP